MIELCEPIEAPVEPKAPKPSLRSWRGFVHLLARFYQNYRAAVLKAARRKKNRAVDIDTQKDKDGVLWSLHWATLGRNKLHDPKHEFTKGARIDSLHTHEVERLRGPKGQRPHQLIEMLELAERHNVRVEVEVKMTATEEEIRDLLTRPKIARMNERGLLQFKTLAQMGDTAGVVSRLTPVKNAGGTTILSFTDYKGRGISKSAAWPVTDYVRGRAKWVA